MNDEPTYTDEQNAAMARRMGMRPFEMHYEQEGTRELYTDEEVLLQAAAWYGDKSLIEELLQPENKLKVNLSFHGREALFHVIQRAGSTENGDRTAETIELIQLLVSHRATITNDHLKAAVETKCLGLVQYLVAQLGLDVGVAIKSKVPGTEEIREWAREWKKVNKLKTKLSSSLNKEGTPTQKRNKI
ncbi:ankyrin repeat domain-containing protein [Burkholderia multivorans]|uniref:ankyrin repeat domain-containing protein n=1 Tax=Burkholderia multivorans TaxID=87883 RepID=UPI0011B21E2A|nr:ankyrin repeat domain-containing protein [Burkholderia multivorans]